MWRLRQAFSRKEKIEKLLANLEELRKKEYLEEEAYNSLKTEYEGYYKDVKDEIEKIKNQLAANLNQTEGKLHDLQANLKTLELRFRVGQLTDRDYQNRNRSILYQIRNTEKRISELKNQISAKSSAEVGGYVDLKVESTKGISFPTFQLPKIEFASPENFITPLRLAGFVASLLMLIFVFLPWVSVDYAGLKEYGFKALETLNTDQETTKVKDFNVGGIFAIFGGILGIFASLIPIRSSGRGLGYLGAGLLGVIGIVAFSGIFANSYREVLDITKEEWGRELANGLSYSPEIGGILFLIVTLVILVIGFLQLRQKPQQYLY